MFAIASAELTMLLRNRLVAACATLIPLAFGAFLILNPSAGGGTGFIAVLQILVMTAMGLYVAGVTTLAARRQTLLLKRLRSGTTSDAAIIAGLILPLVIISTVQIGVILAVLGATAPQPPQNIWLLVVAVLTTQVMFAGFAFATAGVTTSPEHAQITTLPLFVGVLGVAMWVLFTGLDDLGPLKLALPGGALAELVQTAWSSDDLSQVPLLVGISLAWAVAAALVAKVMFRWDPRA